MAVRKLKPTTPGQRHKVIGVFDEITARTPEKSLTVGKRCTGGRNAEGHRTTRYVGGGHKRKFRFIDFKRTKDGVPATVKSIEYDEPFGSHRIALLRRRCKGIHNCTQRIGSWLYSYEWRGRRTRGGERSSTEQNTCWYFNS